MSILGDHTIYVCIFCIPINEHKKNHRRFLWSKEAARTYETKNHALNEANKVCCCVQPQIVGLPFSWQCTLPPRKYISFSAKKCRDFTSFFPSPLKYPNICNTRKKKRLTEERCYINFQAGGKEFEKCLWYNINVCELVCYYITRQSNLINRFHSRPNCLIVCYVQSCLGTYLFIFKYYIILFEYDILRLCKNVLKIHYFLIFS